MSVECIALWLTATPYLIMTAMHCWQAIGKALHKQVGVGHRANTSTPAQTHIISQFRRYSDPGKSTSLPVSALKCTLRFAVGNMRVWRLHNTN